MPQTLDFTVTLYPAAREKGFIVTKQELFGRTYPNKKLQAAGVPHLIQQVSAFAKEHGEACKASVQCHARRKPRGFDAATSDLYFNLEPPSDERSA